jgi:hypothetical protein
MTTWYVDLVNGIDGNNGLSFANRKKNLSAVTGAAAGDTIRVMGRPSTAAGINATFTNKSGSVVLASALTQSLYTSGVAWVDPGASIQTNGSLPGKISSTSASNVEIANGFSTGKAAHFATGTLNLSGYQQLSFWIMSDVAVSAGVFRFDLCSDAAGNTPVDQLTLPAIAANQWHCITINKGSAFGSSIQSIRLFAVSDPGAVTITFDDIIACKSSSSNDCLTLNTLISTDNNVWYGVKTIVGTAVVLNHGGPSSSDTGVWSGTSGSLALNMLQPISRSAAGVAGALLNQTFSSSGTAGNQITVSGGWDTTSMSVQNGLTVLDAVLSSSSSGVSIGTVNFVTLDSFVFARYNTPVGLSTGQQGYRFTNTIFTDCQGISSWPLHAVLFNSFKIVNSRLGIKIPATTNFKTDGENYSLTGVQIVGHKSATSNPIEVSKNIGVPKAVVRDCLVLASIQAFSDFYVMSPCVFYNNSSRFGDAGFIFQNCKGMTAHNLLSDKVIVLDNSDLEVYGLDTSGIGSGFQVSLIGGISDDQSSSMVVYNWTTNGTSSKYSLLNDSFIMSHREGGLSSNNSVYCNNGTITTSGIAPKSGSGLAWRLSPISGALPTSPLSLNVGKVACPANIPTTIKYWAKLSAAGPSAQLRIAGGRYPGVGSAGTDITTAVSATTYTEYGVTITPTEACVVDVFFDVWGSTTQSATISGPATILP